MPTRASTALYSDPEREVDPYALPDIEVFWVEADIASENNCGVVTEVTSGWYYWSCMPGCLPDSEANGPFCSEELAVLDMRANS